ncbi:MAG: hypothetical protein ACE1Y4_03395 [Lysobacterales bacterium]
MSNEPFYSRVRTFTYNDGDTVKVIEDLGHNQYRHISVRIIGVDCPETRLLAQRKAGEAVASLVHEWLCKAPNKGNGCVLYARSDLPGKYSRRCIGDILWCHAPGPDGIKPAVGGLAEWLLYHELGKPYQGGARSWTYVELNNILNRAKAMTDHGWSHMPF